MLAILVIIVVTFTIIIINSFPSERMGKQGSIKLRENCTYTCGNIRRAPLSL